MKRSIVLLLFLPLICIAFIFLIIKFTLASVFLPRTAWKYLVSLDKFMNVILDGDETMTISARAALVKDKYITACVLCKALNLFDKNHCEKELDKWFEETKNRCKID